MTIRFDAPLVGGALALLVTTLLPVSALAKPGDPQSPPARPGDPPADTAKSAQAPASAPVTAPVATADASKPGFVVERLPGSAYPAAQVRGLTGGSLWLNMHGQQWPYYPKTGVGVSGSGWIDTSYEKITRGNNHPDTTYWRPQGRFVLRVTPTYTRGDWFVQAQAELVANSDQTVNRPSVADVDDLWVRIGQWNAWDLQAGRYEAWELYHLGMGLDLNTFERLGADDRGNLGDAVQIYGTTFGYYRPSGVQNLALHAYPLNWSGGALRFEVLGQVGYENAQNAFGIRPSAILDLGILKLKGGGEYRTFHGSDSTVVQGVKSASLASQVERGGGGSIQVVLAPYIEFGASGAIGLVDKTDTQGGNDTEASYTIKSVGGFLNASPFEDFLIGVGANRTTKVDLHRDMNGKVDEYGHTQAFVALQYLVMKQLYVKLVGSYAKSDFAKSFTTDPAFSNEMTGGRLRLMYLF